MEGATQRLAAAEASPTGNLGHGEGRLFEIDTGYLDPGLFHEAGWRDAQLLREKAGQVPGGYTDGAAQRLDRMITGRVRSDELLCGPNRLQRRRIEPDRSGELGLTAGTTKVEYQPTGHDLGSCAVVILFDHRQGHVHPRGHTGGGPDRAALNEEGVRIDVEFRVPLAKLFASGPMGCHPMAAQQPGLSGEETPGTDGEQSAGRGCGGAELLFQPRVPAGLEHSDTTRNRQRVGTNIGQAFGWKLKSRFGSNEAAVQRHHRLVIRRLLQDKVCAGKDLVGPHEVEGLEPGVDQVMDGVRAAHTTIIPAHHDGVNDTMPTISDIEWSQLLQPVSSRSRVMLPH